MDRDRVIQLAERLVEDAKTLHIDARSMADFVVKDDFTDLWLTFNKLKEVMENEM